MTMNETGAVKPAVKRGVTVDFGAVELPGSLHHDEDQRALTLLTEEGPERVSVSLGAYGLVPGPGRVFVKDWSEHPSIRASQPAWPRRGSPRSSDPSPSGRSPRPPTKSR